ncbi:MAG: DUF2244 domain-containing protein [Chromatiaceae bacterium]|nr:DUF2244 domain-containing protein [Gammaproteobacteria bacterium]MCP5300137.1 DUF2244 domain-containing protein [Chromatiaceae bacterium]MCP5422209.1 DUF2244 domain-containing protein [Chromatiaceae bacterium]
MVISESCPDTALRRVVIRPNRSLSWRQSMIFLGAIAVPLLLISMVLAARGFWLILPFAGLELAALYASVYVVSHAARRCEVVSIGETTVTVEKGRDRGRCAERGGPQQRTEFARGWVRVELAESGTSWYPRRLWIVASGRRVEIAEFLAEEEKAELAAELRRLLSV